MDSLAPVPPPPSHPNNAQFACRTAPNQGFVQRVCRFLPQPLLPTSVVACWSESQSLGKALGEAPPSPLLKSNLTRRCLTMLMPHPLRLRSATTRSQEDAHPRARLGMLKLEHGWLQLRPASMPLCQLASSAAEAAAAGERLNRDIVQGQAGSGFSQPRSPGPCRGPTTRGAGATSSKTTNTVLAT